MVADRGVGAIGTNHKVEVDLDFAGSVSWVGGALVSVFEPGLVALEIGAGELVVEEEGDVGHLFEHVEEALIQVATVDGEDALIYSSTHLLCKGKGVEGGFVLTRPWMS